MVLLGRTEAKLEAVFDLIEAGTETRPVVVPADLEHAGEDAATILYHAVRREYGRLDGILHNAGLLGPRTSIAEYPVADWLEVMHVNVNAAFIVTRALMPLLQASSDASVIFTSSGVGRHGRAAWGAYAVSKFALEGLADSIQDNHAHFLVEVHDKLSLANGMKSLGARFARCVNRVYRRTGRVLATRFHHVVKRKPTEVRGRWRACC